jgi:hypothetical protein
MNYKHILSAHQFCIRKKVVAIRVVLHYAGKQDGRFDVAARLPTKCLQRNRVACHYGGQPFF